MIKNISDSSHDCTDHKNDIGFLMRLAKWPKIAVKKAKFFRNLRNKSCSIATLDSGINVPPGITVASPLKNFYITILILFYINLGIAVIFEKKFSSKFFKN